MKKYEFRLEGLDCANCANKIQNKLAENEDYEDVVVNFNTLKLLFKTDKEVIDEEIESIVKSLEPEVNVINLNGNKEKHDHEHEHHHEEHKHCAGHCHEKHAEKGEKHKHIHKDKKSYNLLRVIIGILIMVSTLILNLPEKIELILIVISYVVLLFRTSY